MVFYIFLLLLPGSSNIPIRSTSLLLSLTGIKCYKRQFRNYLPYEEYHKILPSFQMFNEFQRGVKVRLGVPRMQGLAV